MPLPDPAGSRAVLVGVEDYRPLTPLPGVVAGVRRLADLLCDPHVWGLPRDHVTVLDARPSADEILTAVRDAGAATTDTLLVYFAGHGLRGRERTELYLATADADENDVAIGTLPYRTLLDLAKRTASRARRRITFLDCCYSGLAISMGGSAAVLERPDPAQPLSDGYSGPGSWIMTSASGTERSFTSPGGYPYFTGALIGVLENGIRGAGPVLSLDRIAKEVIERLRTREHQGRPVPRPHCGDRNLMGDEPWVRNRAPEAGRAAPVRDGLPGRAAPAPPRYAEPMDFVDALRLLLLRTGITLVPDGVSGGWRMRWLRWRAGLRRTERLIGHLKSPYARTGAMVFTDTHLCLRSGTRWQIPYARLRGASLDTSHERVTTTTVTDQTGISEEHLVFITRLSVGQQALEFREHSPGEVQQALRTFLPLIGELHQRHPEWFP
ncbi:caspase family protein [Streptomyces naphthomycinicus]|uniref:caspase family protein n=1 Tax=Streptomyces naphthomycinicus TaxID=2872625 RepID=UPI0027E56226|nr:caspase family protein [Streptomyces sp. TML10]